MMSLNSIAITLFALIVLMPREGTRVDDRGQSGSVITISTNKSYAVRAAFEDVLASRFEDRYQAAFKSNQSKKNSQLLVAGHFSNSERLNGLRLGSQSALKAPISLASVKIESSWIDTVKSQLNKEQNRRLERVEESLLIDFHATKPDASLKHNIEKADFDRQSRQIVTAAGGSIFVARPGGSADSTPASAARSKRRDETENESLSPKNIEPSDFRKRPFSISGRIRVKGGLAFIPHEMRLEIFRKHEGIVKEKAYVWENRGEFQIQVKQLIGQLSGKLYDYQGALLGQGELDLEDISLPATTEGLLNDVQVELEPVEKTKALKVVSVHSLGGKEFQETDIRARHVSEMVQIENEGAQLVASELVDQSISELILEKEGFISTRVRARFEEQQRVFMFPERFIQALLGLVLDPNKAAIDSKGGIRGIIMGQVVGSNKTPLAGAQIELAEQSEIQPIYFNSHFLPDPSLSQTSENGLYAFVDLRQGHYAIRAKFEEEVFPAQVISVTDGVVTQVQFESAPKKRITLELAGLFADKFKVNGSVSVFGSGESFTAEGSKASLLTSLTDQFQILEVVPQDSYMSTRLNFYPSQRHLSLPLLSLQDARALSLKQKVDLNQTGTIYGQGPSKNYEVVVVSTNNGEKAGRVLYGKSWSSIDQRAYGEKGDSFVVIDLEPGFYSVSVVALDEEQVYSDLVFSEPGFANLVADPRSAAR